MKKLIFTLCLTQLLAVPAFAQSQSTYAILGGFEYLFERIFNIDSSPNPDYRIDYDNQETRNKLTQFNLKAETRIPNIETSFAFTNNNDDFDDVIKKDMGVCRGYSSLRRKIRLLSHFDLENKAGVEIPSRKKERKYKKFYRNIIRDIRNYKFRVIPGFANLYQMSQDPILSKVLKWEVVHEWRDKNFSPGMGTGQLLKGLFTHSTYEELLELRDRVEKNAQLNHNTLVWLSEKASSWMHALEAIEATPVGADGSFKIIFWNDKYVQLDRARSSLLVTGKGRILYDDTIIERELYAAGVAAENDGEMEYMSQKLQEFCQNQPEGCAVK